MIRLIKSNVKRSFIPTIIYIITNYSLSQVCLMLGSHFHLPSAILFPLWVGAMIVWCYTYIKAGNYIMGLGRFFQFHLVAITFDPIKSAKYEKMNPAEKDLWMVSEYYEDIYRAKKLKKLKSNKAAMSL